MARILRVDRPSLGYHLTARGNEQRLTFRDDCEREHFLELLAQWTFISVGKWGQLCTFDK